MTKGREKGEKIDARKVYTSVGMNLRNLLHSHARSVRRPSRDHIDSRRKRVAEEYEIRNAVE